MEKNSKNKNKPDIVHMHKYLTKQIHLYAIHANKTYKIQFNTMFYLYEYILQIKTQYSKRTPKVLDTNIRTLHNIISFLKEIRFYKSIQKIFIYYVRILRATLDNNTSKSNIENALHKSQYFSQ